MKLLLASSVVSDNTHFMNDAITPETLVLIQQKHEIRKQFGSKSVEYKFAKSICKKLYRTNKQKHIDKMHLKINLLRSSMKYYIVMKN